ncbi:fumarylacetoacetate hydrolase family protein [Bradyrhizobium sp. 200]|uniref:fumarylacetoacetate hydrolase family protein n=1 Tax=Bradyrhizobium sp. 200 TaxID=2782665 RepID=UPI001FFFBE3F|nr:fumarylacetoacetate hydrolase family protein [Bradyrhizobium sp. 200]UPJ48401.1 fumarylacetoacetate hydrolase family protein [Bradyrhizobium sp. 200]
MRFATFRNAGMISYGLAKDGGLVDLGKRLPQFPSVKSLLANKGFDLARSFEAAPLDVKLSEIELLPPILDPENIWCIGINYPERNDEYVDGSERTSYPSVFCRSPNSLVGDGTPIVKPAVSEQFDYEGEIAIVIGKRSRHIAPEQALSHIFGLTLCNEGTIRDWTRHGRFNVTQGKNFDSSGSIGPWIVTADELPPSNHIQLSTHVNGELRQTDNTRRMLFPFDYLISYLTAFATLNPGDIILTGTPTGAGARHNPPKWLAPGDLVEVSVPEIGTLRNQVVDEQISRDSRNK